MEANFRRSIVAHPDAATFLGIHTEDQRLPDGTREAIEDQVAQARAHRGAIEALDPAGLSAEVRFERDIEVHNLGLELFDLEEQRLWERRSTAMDGIGDPLFGLFARNFAPLEERLASLTGRLEAIPRFLAEHRTRATVPQVRLWQQFELESAGEMPSFFDEIVAAGSVLPEPEQRRLGAAAERAKVAVTDYEGFLRGTLDTAVDSWPLGRERYDELVARRAFDGQDAGRIVEIGWEQLGRQRAARTAAAREVDPTVDEATVIDRLKSDHPATFDEALDAYREAMVRARGYLIEHDIVSVPADERIEVLPTPGVPAPGDALRGLLRRPQVRPRPAGHLHRHAIGGRRPERDARAQLEARSAIPASTRRTPATTCSCPSPGGTPASAG